MTFGNDAKGCFEKTFLSSSIINFSLQLLARLPTGPLVRLGTRLENC